MRILKILGEIILCCLVLFAIIFTSNSLAQLQATEKEKFKEHLNLIKGMDTSEKIQQTQKYLKNLSDKELFNLMDALGQEDPSSIQQGLFISHIKSRWDNNPPVSNIANEVKSKQRDKNYRKTMIDYLTSSLKKKARSEIKTDLAISEVKSVVQDYRNIIADEADIKEIRSYAISNISSLLGILRESGNLTAQEKTNYGDFFIKKLSDSAEDEFLRSRAAKALRSLDDRRALPYLKNIIRDTKTQEVLLKRSAVVTLAKMSDTESIPDILKLMEDTSNEEVFRTAVYAMSIYKKPETIRQVMKNKNRFDVRTNKSLLRGYKETIEEIFKSNNRPYLVDAINVLRFAELEELKSYVFTLVTDSDRGVRMAAIEAMLQIGNKEDLKQVSEGTKSESDPIIIKLLKEVKAESERVYLQPDKSTEPTEENKEGSR